MRHQARSFARALGPWRDTRDEAIRDAIKAKEAHRDPEGGPVFFSVGCRIVAEMEVALAA